MSVENMLIRVINKSEWKPLVLNGNDRIEIAPGASRILPFALVAAWFGDPRAVDAPKNPARRELHDQTRRLWGYEPGFDTEDTWNMKRPNVECFDVNTDERVYFLLDDPDGIHGFNGQQITDVTSASADVALLSAQMTAMQERHEAQMSQLLGVLATLTAQTQAAQGAIVPADANALATVEANAGIKDDAGAQVPTAPADSGNIKVDAPRATRVGKGS